MALLIPLLVNGGKIFVAIKPVIYLQKRSNCTSPTKKQSTKNKPALDHFIRIYQTHVARAKSLFSSSNST